MTGTGTIPLSETQRLSLLAMFGTLWALAELQLGNQLHWARVPFAGLVLTACGVFVLVSARMFVPRLGSAVAVGLVVAAIKAVLGGPGGQWAAIGILAESSAIELVFLTGPLSPGRAAVAGGAAMIWSFFHPFLVQGLVAGLGVLRIYGLILKKAAAVFGLGTDRPWILLAALFGLHVLFGAASGAVGWRLSVRISRTVPLSTPRVQAVREG